MSEELQERCENCRFWDRDTIRDGNLCECHRHSPTIVAAQGGESDEIPFCFAGPEFRVFPVTLSSDWCGEFQPKPGIKEDSVGVDPKKTIKPRDYRNMP